MGRDRPGFTAWRPSAQTVSHGDCRHGSGAARSQVPCRISPAKPAMESSWGRRAGGGTLCLRGRVGLGGQACQKGVQVETQRGWHVGKVRSWDKRACEAPVHFVSFWGDGHPSQGPAGPPGTAAGSSGLGGGQEAGCCRPPPFSSLLRLDSGPDAPCVHSPGLPHQCRGGTPGPWLWRGPSHGHVPLSGCTNSHSGPSDPQARRSRALSRGTGCSRALGGTGGHLGRDRGRKAQVGLGLAPAHGPVEGMGRPSVSLPRPSGGGLVFL